jgi:hypothetical protein
MRDLVREAIADLPERERSVFLLRQYHDMTYVEISRITGLSTRTIPELHPAWPREDPDEPDPSRGQARGGAGVMRCDAVRDRLADYAVDECGRFTTFRVRRHLDRCSACEEALREEERLNARLATWEDAEPPEAVWLRIRDAVGGMRVPETIPLAWWERARTGLLRWGVPYVLGAATMAIIIVASGSAWASACRPRLPRLRSRTSSSASCGTSRSSASPSLSGPATSPSLLWFPSRTTATGSGSVRGQDLQDLIELLRKRGLSLPDEALGRTPARPAGFDDETH